MVNRKKPDSGLPDWLELLETDALSALEEVREAVRQAEFINDETKQDAIGFIVECIRKAKSNPRYFAALQRSSVFSDDGLGPRKLSIYVARFILDVENTTGSRYEKARSYGQLADYFAETDWGAEQVASYLRKYGIRNSLEHIRKVDHEATAKAGDLDEEDDAEDYETLLPDTDIARPNGQSENGAPLSAPPSRADNVKRALAKEPRPKPARPKLNLDTMFVTEAHELLLIEILKTPVGGKVTFTARREPDIEGQDWKRFVVEDVE